jgi:hypothetical protein
MRNKERQLGALLLIAGLGICAWQVYELRETNHLTFWVIFVTSALLM